MIDRRQMLIGGAVLTGSAALPSRAFAQAGDPLSMIAAEIGGRMGIAALDTGNGHRLLLDPGGRYPLCSTFKWVLAAAVLARVDRGELALSRMIAFSRSAIEPNSPVVEAALSTGQLSIEALCKAAVEDSDNAAANLLLPQIGGPGALTRFIRAAGDPVTRLDRYEPELNQFSPDDPRDTTMPYAMLLLMQSLLLHEPLSIESRERLIGWMVACRTGLTKLRAGLPGDWRIGDKTGNSGKGQINDVAIAMPPGRKPILISCYVDAPIADATKVDAAMARVGALVGAVFGAA